MTVSNQNPLSYLGVRALNPPNQVIASRAPGAQDIQFDIGTFWTDSVAGNLYELSKIVANNATWNLLGTNTGPLNTLTGGTGGALAPTANNINILGTAGQITSTGAVSTITLSVPAAFIAPGSIASTTTVTAGTGLTVTAGGAAISGNSTINGGTVGIGTDNAANAISIGVGTTARNVHIADSAAAHAVTIGSVTGSLAVGCPSTVTLASGAGTGLAVDTSAGSGIGATFRSSAATVDAVQLTVGGLKVPVTSNAAGASPQIVSARFGQAIFTDVIANGAFGTLTVTNTLVSGSSVIIACASCSTVNSAVQIAQINPGAGSFAVRLFNAGSASTGANILINFWVLN